MLYHGDTEVLDLRSGGENIQCLLNAGRVIFVRSDPNAAGLPSVLGLRFITESGSNGVEKWFEVGLPVPTAEPLTGNPSAGWVAMNGFFGIVLPWSEDLIHWSVGKFSDSGPPESATLDGVACLVHWARSMHPVDSETKNGSMSAGGGYSPYGSLNPLISLTLNSTLIPLPHFPYTMPGDAALMQANIRAAGYAGATVTATSALDWVIYIPAITLTVFGAQNHVDWPGFLVPDEYGNMVNWSSSMGFGGEFVNGAGVRTHLAKQFARLGVNVLKL